MLASRKSLTLLILILLAGVLAQCAHLGSVKVTPKLGDTRQRETDGMTIVFVPEGEFTMGIDVDAMREAIELCKNYLTEPGPGWCLGSSYADEMPAHLVELDSFWIDSTEVTNHQYALCVQAGGCSPPTEPGSFTREIYYSDPDYAEYPVVWVRQEQAEAYCAWVGGRLPTEAEWEYAARGPESFTFPWGNDWDPTRANYCDASCPAGAIDPSYDDAYPDTAPVGSFPQGASWCGALDMAGNVREWVADWFYYYTADPQFNPTGPDEGETHTPKGGCWLDTPEKLRSTNRGQNTPDYSRHKVGFRCVMEQ